MKVYILIFLVPAVLGTGTKPSGAEFGNRAHHEVKHPLFRPLSGNRPYYKQKQHVFGNRPYMDNSKAVETKINSLSASLKGVPMGNRRYYDVQDPTAHMGNRPYYIKEKNTDVAEKKVPVKKNIPMGNRRSYENLYVPVAIKPYYGKVKNTEVAEKKVAEVPMGNRPYYGKVKNTDVAEKKVAEVPMGNRPYYGKVKNTDVAEKKVAEVSMGNRPYYVNHIEARPYKGKFYGNRAYYGSPSQEYLNRHHSKILMGNRKYDDSTIHGTKLHDHRLNTHMGNRKYYEDETRFMGNRPFYAESKHTKENNIPKVVNSPPREEDHPMFGNRPYNSQQNELYDW